MCLLLQSSEGKKKESVAIAFVIWHHREHYLHLDEQHLQMRFRMIKYALMQQSHIFTQELPFLYSILKPLLSIKTLSMVPVIKVPGCCGAFRMYCSKESSVCLRITMLLPQRLLCLLPCFFCLGCCRSTDRSWLPE